MLIDFYINKSFGNVFGANYYLDNSIKIYKSLNE